MHFVQINKTTWRCTGEGPRNPATGKRRQITRRGKSKGDAREKVEKAIAELKKAYTFDAKVTFEEFSQDWLKLYRMKGNKETTNEHRAYCISLLNRYLAKKKMTAITTIEIQGTLNHLFENGTAYYTLRGTHNAAKMMFAYAMEIGLIEMNPIEASFVPKKKLTLEDVSNEETTKLYLETDELKEFLSYVDKHRNIMYRTLIYTIAFTGMRPGEAIALKLEDVDLDKKIININKTVYAKKSIRGDFELTPPKTFGSVRSVDIDDIVVEKLKQLYQWREDREWFKSDFVFGDKEGIPPTVKMLNQTVRRLGALTDIQKQFRTYILRHTHISLLAEADVDLNFIMNRVGHKNSDTTTKIYLHVTSGMRAVATEKMHAKFTELIT
ncbi:site-specific integrase [Lysinibacillus sphaericus]|uniref:tyrosine-type recombinase/integrase n=1 Tax=Lysinibacillus sphaericus TaxID=1421 RepID=UPI0005696BC3|nr:site-specific integrase [Lysinibacillus sphaericus]QTB24288.1 site-specific integrase [Lysinibacillus sphaericus]